MAKKFKRYLSHNVGTGRDTHPRDLAVSEETMARNWCRTFGHKRLVTPEGLYGTIRCLDCGATQQLRPPK